MVLGNNVTLALLLSLKGNLIMSLFSNSRRISLLFGHYDETLPPTTWHI